MRASFIRSQPPAASATRAPFRRAAGVERPRARAWVLAAVGLALLGAGCNPTKGNDNAFEPAPTTNKDFNLPDVYAVGIQPYSIAVAPPSPACTSASAPNVAVANYASDSISYLTNNGSGKFTVTTLPTLFAPTKVVFVDLNASGPGTCDLVVMHTINVNGTGQAISVMLTTDNVNWSTSVYPLPGVPEQIAVVDMNGDSFPDIVVSIPSTLQIGVLLNNGTGGFTGPFYTTLAFQPTRFVATNFAGAKLDFDGDVCTDLAVLTPGANQVQVLKSANPGICTPGAVAYAVTAVAVNANPFGIAAADLDNPADGLPELIVTAPGDSVVNILKNSPRGTFSNFLGTPLPDQAGGQRILVGLFAPLTGPIPTIAVVHPGSGTVNNFKISSGAFSTAGYLLNNIPFDLASGKITTSGYLDLAVPEQKLRVLYIGRGDGTGQFSFSQIGFLSAPSTPVVQRLRPGGTAQDIVVPLPLDNSVMILLNKN